jgi:hypothetical protein
MRRVGGVDFQHEQPTILEGARERRGRRRFRAPMEPLSRQVDGLVGERGHAGLRPLPARDVGVLSVAARLAIGAE